MSYFLDHTDSTYARGSVRITGSKSESNRLLVLQDLFPQIRIENLSDSDDTKHLITALQSKATKINIGHAGTAMRFLTALFAAKKGQTIQLTGSNRMQNRPIKILVEALKQLGASIQYVEKHGYPPLVINGRELSENKVLISGQVSSQYISALLLIAPYLRNGLELQISGKLTSVPYVNMTLSLLQEIGVTAQWKADRILVSRLEKPSKKTLIVSPDWSSASYFYSLVALQDSSNVELPGFKSDSRQGDQAIVDYYKAFGVRTRFTSKGIVLTKTAGFKQDKKLEFDLVNTPDLAQTIAVTCLGLGVDCHLRGLHTLKIKETDRLVALKNELEKLGAKVLISEKDLQLFSPSIIQENCHIHTYQDHRMAMAFAPLSTLVPIYIEDEAVVSKSYPGFWLDFESLF